MVSVSTRADHCVGVVLNLFLAAWNFWKTCGSVLSRAIAPAGSGVLPALASFAMR